jgi:hypothetical protein
MQSKLPMNLSARCGAKTRRGSECHSPAMPNGRCRMHGGSDEITTVKAHAADGDAGCLEVGCECHDLSRSGLRIVGVEQEDQALRPRVSEGIVRAHRGGREKMEDQPHAKQITPLREAMKAEEPALALDAIEGRVPFDCLAHAGNGAHDERVEARPTSRFQLGMAAM